MSGTDSYYQGRSANVRSYCAPGDPVCDFSGWLDDTMIDCGLKMPWCHHFGYISNGYTGAAVTFLLEHVTARPAPSPRPSAPVVTRSGSYREGELVYARVDDADADGDAEGFGFQWHWGTEIHSFADPSFGRVAAGRVDYPFNLGCGGANEQQVDVRMWVYDRSELSSEPVDIHLACSPARPGRSDRR